MNNCAQCGATGTALLRTRLANHDDVYLGMPVTLLNAVDHFKCTACGHTLNVIANQEGLIAAVALCRVMMPVKLNGTEIKLLRKAMGLKAIGLAKELTVSPETISRWENDAEVIGLSNERTFRLLAAVALQSKAPAIDVDLKALVAMEVTPLRPANWPVLCLEAVRLKADTRKETQWDKAA